MFLACILLLWDYLFVSFTVVIDKYLISSTDNSTIAQALSHPLTDDGSILNTDLIYVLSTVQLIYLSMNK